MNVAKDLILHVLYLFRVINVKGGVVNVGVTQGRSQDSDIGGDAH
jgi:hypothetical protein